MRSSLFFKKSKLGSVFQKVQLLRPQKWTAGVLTVSRLVLAVNSSVQGYLLICCAVLIGRSCIIFLSSYQLWSYRIIGYRPLSWGLMVCEVLLIYFFLIFKYIPVSFLLCVLLPYQPHRKTDLVKKGLKGLIFECQDSISIGAPSHP